MRAVQRKIQGELARNKNGLRTDYRNMISCLSASFFQDMLVVLQLQY